MKYIQRYQTPEGFDDLLMCSDDEALEGLWFEGSRDSRCFVETLQETFLPSVLSETSRWLDVYFSGCQPDFMPAYRIDNLTPFRKLVSDIMLEIPFGQIVTYGEIAKHIVEMRHGTFLSTRKMSAQAVGGAVGWNPICIIIPCHRVLGVNGNLTGYGGGMHNKIALLKHEGHDTNQFSIPNQGNLF